MPVNFSFILPGKLAGMERPGSWGTLQQDLEFLRDQGIVALVSLIEDNPITTLPDHITLNLLHLPVKDFTPPTMEQIEQFVAFVDNQSGAVTVHCQSGIGRTGTMLACYLVHAKNLSGVEAIARVRNLRPGSIETQKQEQVIHNFAAKRSQAKESSLE